MIGILVYCILSTMLKYDKTYRKKCPNFFVSTFHNSNLDSHILLHNDLRKSQNLCFVNHYTRFEVLEVNFGQIFWKV